MRLSARNVERIVFTGGPSSGKTSVLEFLAKRGYTTFSESGREALQELGSPRTSQEIERLERRIYELQSKKEENGSELSFFDRSQIDNRAYAQHLLGYIPKQMILPPYKYNRVFLFDRLPFVADGTRTESSDQEAQDIHEMLQRAYEEEGYTLIRVPTLPSPFIEESITRRADYILEILNEARD